MLAAACAGGTAVGSPSPIEPSAGPTQPPAEPTGAEATAAPGGQPSLGHSPDTTPAPTVALPADPWRTAQLHDVRSGETFTINDLAGRLVVIEPMAIWCANCAIQQDEARAALEALATDEIVYVSLDVDPNETEADLARYADEREYPWRFVVASTEASRALATAFGDQVLSPPSTPKILIDPDGTAEVSFGIKPATELEEYLAARLP